MRFLADESVDMAIVRALRQAGHDILAIAEESPGLEDEQIAERARREGLTLLTEIAILAGSSLPLASLPAA
jgi:phage replication-related protein YjqB (UPF0714/DUF867 family)